MHYRFLNAQNVTPVKPGEDITGIHNFDIFVIQVTEGCSARILKKKMSLRKLTKARDFQRLAMTTMISS